MCIELMSFAISECRWTWHEMMVWDGFLPVYGPQHWPKCPQRMRRSLRRSRMGWEPGGCGGLGGVVIFQWSTQPVASELVDFFGGWGR